MDLKDIKELIAVMRKNRIKEINLDQDDSKIHIVASDPPERKRDVAPVVPLPAPVHYYAPPAALAPHPAAAAPAPGAPEAAPAAAVAAPAPAPAVVEEEESVGVEITSPMVGTFYRAPAPDAPPYIDVGNVVGDDTVLCIIEAMKLMNEIKAETRGKILKVLLKNGEPVEFGQPLFLVEPF